MRNFRTSFFWRNVGGKTKHIAHKGRGTESVKVGIKQKRGPSSGGFEGDFGCDLRATIPLALDKADMTRSQNNYHVNYVVVGSGVAGVRAAIELSNAGSVLVLAKADLSESATAYAQGGIAVALSDEDEIGLHEQDTINAGDGLCNPAAVALLVEEGPRYIAQLIEWGTEFDRSGTKLAFTREAAHSRSRILHAHGDSTGREISRALLARAHTIPHLHLRAHAFTTELILENKRAVGVRFIDEKDSSLHELHAGAVLLATGGLGQL